MAKTMTGNFCTTYCVSQRWSVDETFAIIPYNNTRNLIFNWFMRRNTTAKANTSSDGKTEMDLKWHLAGKNENFKS